MKSPRDLCRFEASVNYLKEYLGVKGVVICDGEGLVVSDGGENGFDGELYAAIALSLVKLADEHLSRLTGPGAEYISVKTASDWLTVASSGGLYLVVAAGRQADDLLNVRISRALEMIASHLKEKYPALSVLSKSEVKGSHKEVEALNV